MSKPLGNDTPQFSSETDREVLTALYNATGGDGWERHDGWLDNGPIGEWEGVVTNAAGRVESLELSPDPPKKSA